MGEGVASPQELTGLQFYNQRKSGEGENFSVFLEQVGQESFLVPTSLS